MLKQRIHTVLDIFFKVTTGIVIVSAIYIYLFWGTNAQFSLVQFLGQILTTAALCSLVGLLGEPEHELSKMAMLFRIIGCYVYENIVVLGCGVGFKWFYFSDWKMLLGMVIAIAVVFMGIMVLGYCSDYKTAQKMNEKLMKR